MKTPSCQNGNKKSYSFIEQQSNQFGLSRQVRNNLFNLSSMDLYTIVALVLHESCSFSTKFIEPKVKEQTALLIMHCLFVFQNKPQRHKQNLTHACGLYVMPGYRVHSLKDSRGLCILQDNFFQSQYQPRETHLNVQSMQTKMVSLSLNIRNILFQDETKKRLN